MGREVKTATPEEVAKFVEIFTTIKSERRGKKCKVNGLSDKDNKKLKKLLNRGFEWDQFERAVTMMYDDKSASYPNGYAWETGNDTPTHVLWEEVFERYLNKADLAEVKAAEAVAVKTDAAPPNVSGIMKQVLTYQPTKEDIEKMNVAKALYTKALETGEWTGSVFDAMAIGRLFSDSFTVKEKIGFQKEAEELVGGGSDTKRVGGGSMADAFERMARTYPRNIMFEVAVKEAVKRKITEPWEKMER